MTELGYSINALVGEAKTRWLKPAEVLFILQNHEESQLTHKPLQRPASGSLFLVNKRVLRYFRKDGHNWRKKKDGKNVGEAHERLKVGNAEALNCYYAHGEQNSNFQRRSYWMLDPAYEHIVFVHYRDITEGRHNARSISHFSPGSTAPSSSPSSSECYEPLQSLSSSGDEEFSFSLVIEGNVVNHLDMRERTREVSTSSEQEFNQALQKNEEQLSLNNHSVEDVGQIYSVNANSNNLENTMQDQNSSRLPGIQGDLENIVSTQYSDYYIPFFEQGQNGERLETDWSLTIAQKQNFVIWEISPEWGYSTEATKVIIVGSFLCDPSGCTWTCMFGDIEVPLQIIQKGVFLCKAPPHSPGKVSLCITSGNRESCSEIREFEYRVEQSSCSVSNLPSIEGSRSPEELLLLVRFVQMLLSDPAMKKGENADSGCDPLGKLRTSEDSWDQVIESLLVGNNDSSSSTIDWLLVELLKDKLQQWLSSKSQKNSEKSVCSLSKKEQVIIHMVAGLGFEWALNPILNLGVGANFRDINGWTALHWAARFGREKIVVALIASGALAGAFGDPSSQDHLGKTPASLASAIGHRGLAGYLSEMALTSHLSSLSLEEKYSELSKGPAEVEAERTINSLSGMSLTTNEDRVSLNNALAAVRNAVQAASRIQSAFRIHSFRKKQQRENVAKSATTALASRDGYSFLLYNAAALCIQKKYRGWKGQKNFLAFRKKVVKIQAHVRGHQARRRYMVCWAVGIMEKIMLRWLKRGVGLRGFRNGVELTDETEDEDFLKLFRLQKVYPAINEAVSRVLSLVDSSEARQQYQRILQIYQQAKAEGKGLESEAASASHDEIFYMGSYDFYK